MSFARALYSAITWGLSPCCAASCAAARAEPGYAVAVHERFGRYAQPLDSLVGHSGMDALGALCGFMRYLWAKRGRLPSCCASCARKCRACACCSPTARPRAGPRAKKLLQPGDVQVWLPWDTPGAVARFLRQFRPAIGVLMETEVWRI